MTVRGWLIIGDIRTAATLPPEKSCGFERYGPPPPAADQKPGDWLIWTSGPTAPSVVIVCVDIPL